jgi:Flp pilus assembly protein CpaB
MGKRTLVLVIALVLAAVSAFAIWSYLSGVEDDVRKDIVAVRVFRATQPISTGTTGEQASETIEESQALQENVVFEESTILCVGPVPNDNQNVDPSVCTNNPSNLDALLDGTVAAGPISAGQLITSDLFILPAELNSASLSEQIPQGKVAISMRPTEVDAVGGFIRPGDRINLIASANINLNSSFELLKDPELRELLIGAGFGQPVPGTGSTTDPAVDPVTGEPVDDPVTTFVETLPSSIEFTQTVLQNLEVLAVGADTRDAPLGTGLEPQGSQIITLELTPEQAEKIEFSKQFTSIALMLLPDPEQFPYTEFEARGVTTDDLFDLVPRIQEILAPLEGLLGS